MKVNNNALRKAVSIAGSQKALGDLIGFTQQGISKMLQENKCTAETAMKIEQATGVLCSDIRPDLSWFAKTKEADQPQIGQ